MNLAKAAAPPAAAPAHGGYRPPTSSRSWAGGAKRSGHARMRGARPSACRRSWAAASIAAPERHVAARTFAWKGAGAATGAHRKCWRTSRVPERDCGSPWRWLHGAIRAGSCGNPSLENSGCPGGRALCETLTVFKHGRAGTKDNAGNARGDDGRWASSAGRRR